jgi:adenylosuccinate lyase
MPHKKNPISAENLCGLARLLRSSVSAACENIPLWHERDISHSSVERVIMPDATTLADYMVQRAAKLVGGLSVRVDRMIQNLASSGDLYASEKVMLALVRTGLSRQNAYELVQRHALACVAERGTQSMSFFDRLRSDPLVSERLANDVLAHCFEIATHLQHVPTIFARTLPE